MNIDSILKVIRGIVRLRGNSDNTLIGNVSDSLKTNVTASALPTGASTEAKQDTGNASLTSIDGKVSTAAKQDTGNASLTSIDGKVSTAAKQDVGNTSLSSLDSKATARNASLTSIDGKVSTAANQVTLNTRVGDLTETAPASDTASSGLNGRLQRIAQRITSLIALIPTAVGIPWFIRISNGVYTAIVSAVGELRTADILDQAGTQGAITLGTTATEVKVGGSKLANRKSVTVHNNSTKTIYWGYTSGVTTATGTPIPKSTAYSWDRGSGANATIYIIAADTGLNVRITEGA